MLGSMVSQGRELYHQDRLWQLMVKLIAAALVALCLIKVCQKMFGANNPNTMNNQQHSASYKPTVPPRAFSSGGPSNSGRTINMPMSAQDVASNERLKTLHLAAQSIDKSSHRAKQCEQYLLLGQDITADDKKRAKPVHNQILTEISRCKLSISQSDERFSTLESAAKNFQQLNDVDSAIALINSSSQLTNFDKERTNFSLFEGFLANLNLAEQLKNESDNRVATLVDAFRAFEGNSTIENEEKLLTQFSKLTQVDKSRQYKGYQLLALNTSQKVAHDKIKRTQNLIRLESLVNRAEDQENITDTDLEAFASVLNHLNTTKPQLLTRQEKSLMEQASRLSFAQQVQKLSGLTTQYKNSKNSELIDPIAAQFSHLKTSYPNRVTTLDNEINAISLDAVSKIAASNQRLAALVSAANSLENKMSPTSITQIQHAQGSLTALDLSRLKAEHRKAIKLAEKASSGVLESDERIKNFVLVFNTYSKQGCTKSNLKNLRISRNNLSDLDIERSTANVKEAIQVSNSYLSRTYCVNTFGKIKPIGQ
ncbi:hypothetical protein GSF04_11620 [Pseudoalteromonas sp. A22]|uniref:hypothetical protein n=1 Tax=Pseudoalteromonas sp. A22 TaxID=327511 RepID=UPI001BA6DFCD|nr:hypothetical protein [Pseudoalteromonas sp. A22]QUI63120.1 hypothetical protein GSF04_11620 [Pseudoalteromonas sp. A22]